MPMFGDYQDAMKSGEAFVLTVLSGRALIWLTGSAGGRLAAEARLHTHQAPINAVEGLFARYWAGANLFAGSIG